MNLYSDLMYPYNDLMFLHRDLKTMFPGWLLRISDNTLMFVFVAFMITQNLCVFWLKIIFLMLR